jgi:AcrR family transcriptional regulator
MDYMKKGERTKQTILEQATSLASRIGLEALSIGRLAEELDMSKSGIFAHFGSKESLQMEVLQFAAESFVELVVRPSFQAPRGEPRIQALFQNWLIWAKTTQHRSGCLFVQAATEFDDQPGPIRDALEKLQREWLGGLVESARRAQAEGHFRQDLDPEQFAFELYALLLGYHNSYRLLNDPQAEARVRAAVEDLLQRSH